MYYHYSKVTQMKYKINELYTINDVIKFDQSLYQQAMENRKPKNC